MGLSMPTSHAILAQRATGIMIRVSNLLVGTILALSNDKCSSGCQCLHSKRAPAPTSADNSASQDKFQC
eukprot:1153006-Amphidinium_carterae.1